MTNNADAQIAREWASKALDNVFLNEVPIEWYRAAARHILATTTPPTMADVDWDDAVHAGLCAEHCDSDVVLMLGKEPGDDDLIYCRWFAYGEMIFGPLARLNLTPIPGTKIDLTPRREPEPESTPDHPEVLATQEDYENAPAGTIVASGFSDPWVKDSMGFWLGCGADEGETSSVMVRFARRVLRWGEAL